MTKGEIVRLVEFLIAPKGGCVLINPHQISSCVPQFDHDDLWTHTRIHMASGGAIDVNASLDQIEEALLEAQS